MVSVPMMAALMISAALPLLESKRSNVMRVIRWGAHVGENALTCGFVASVVGTVVALFCTLVGATLPLPLLVPLLVAPFVFTLLSRGAEGVIVYRGDASHWNDAKHDGPRRLFDAWAQALDSTHDSGALMKHAAPILADMLTVRRAVYEGGSVSDSVVDGLVEHLRAAGAQVGGRLPPPSKPVDATLRRELSVLETRYGAVPALAAPPRRDAGFPHATMLDQDTRAALASSGDHLAAQLLAAHDELCSAVLGTEGVPPGACEEDRERLAERVGTPLVQLAQVVREGNLTTQAQEEARAAVERALEACRAAVSHARLAARTERSERAVAIARAVAKNFG